MREQGAVEEGVVEDAEGEDDVPNPTMPTPPPAFPPAIPASAVGSATPGGATPGGEEHRVAEESPTEEVLAHPTWRRKYTYVDLPEGCADDESALVWIEAVLRTSLPRPLIEALRTGSVLCRLINAIEPGIVREKLCEDKDTNKPFEVRFIRAQ